MFIIRRNLTTETMSYINFIEAHNLICSNNSKIFLINLLSKDRLTSDWMQNAKLFVTKQFSMIL